jgi:hypothetical protein
MSRTRRTPAPAFISSPFVTSPAYISGPVVTSPHPRIRLSRLKVHRTLVLGSTARSRRRRPPPPTRACEWGQLALHAGQPLDDALRLLVASTLGTTARSAPLLPLKQTPATMWASADGPDLKLARVRDRWFSKPSRWERSQAHVPLTWRAQGASHATTGHRISKPKSRCGPRSSRSRWP